MGSGVPGLQGEAALGPHNGLIDRQESPCAPPAGPRTSHGVQALARTPERARIRHGSKRSGIALGFCVAGIQWAEVRQTPNPSSSPARSGEDSENHRNCATWVSSLSTWNSQSWCRASSPNTTDAISATPYTLTSFQWRNASSTALRFRDRSRSLSDFGPLDSSYAEAEGDAASF